LSKCGRVLPQARFPFKRRVFPASQVAVMPEPTKIPLVVFAQVPPPEHGQSRMVASLLEVLRAKPEQFEIAHVNARFSKSMDEIGESSVQKALLSAKFLWQALRVRVGMHSPVLYYVPGPVKWSSVLRDWILLAVLRLLFRKVVFHWHAIGQGEWAHGSGRLKLPGPGWLDGLGRKVSALVLARPSASFAVSPNSQADALAVASRELRVVCNGIADPCPEHAAGVRPGRVSRQQAITAEDSPCFRILFLSHGSVEKGLTDALACLEEALGHPAAGPRWRFDVSLVGGVSEAIRGEVDAMVARLLERWPERLVIRERGFVVGLEKSRCYREHDIFLASSRWESFCLTVAEAMAHGMPVVAAGSDGVKGVLPAGYPYVSPVAQPRQLAGDLIRCCRELCAGKAVERGDLLRDWFLRNYQLDSFARNVVANLVEVVEADKRRHALPRGSEAGSPLRVQAYLADQNPKLGRSLGILRMTEVVLAELAKRDDVGLTAVASRTSMQVPGNRADNRVLPWSTRMQFLRVLTDHLHPLFPRAGRRPDICFYPKGFLPLTNRFCRPTAVTIHDTIIQYYRDHYPKWRQGIECRYLIGLLKHSLRSADCILTVSQASKRQILECLKRYGLPPREITVTYEPCIYEALPQPDNPPKGNYVIHLASREPHKRTAQLVRWWVEARGAGSEERQAGEVKATADGVRPRYPFKLQLVGTLPPEVRELAENAPNIVIRPFLEEPELQNAIMAAKALLFPSEIEGFGLPAIEAYYLGTPVCFTCGTSIEEVLKVATTKGGFLLDDASSLFAALDEVLAMTPAEVRACGLKLRHAYAASVVAEKMVEAFRKTGGTGIFPRK